MLVSSNGILKADLSGNVTTFIENSNGTNGMGWDQQGRLIAVQRAPKNEKVGVLYPPDKVTTLADNFQGKPFNSLNDMALDKRGGVYFTDTQGIYYLPPGGTVSRIIDEVPRPNGLVLSPDEKTLYVHNKDGVYMLAFDVAANGTISNRRNFARYKSVRIPDTRIRRGMKTTARTAWPSIAMDAYTRRPTPEWKSSVRVGNCSASCPSNGVPKTTTSESRKTSPLADRIERPST